MQRKQHGLIIAEINRERHPVLQESHKRDLDGFALSIYHVTELDGLDRALECGSRADSATNEHLAAASRE